MVGAEVMLLTVAFVAATAPAANVLMLWPASLTPLDRFDDGTMVTALHVGHVTEGSVVLGARGPWHVAHTAASRSL